MSVSVQFRCRSYEGQFTLVVPSKDLVIVRLGHSGDGADNWIALYNWIAMLPAHSRAGSG